MWTPQRASACEMDRRRWPWSLALLSTLTRARWPRSSWRFLQGVRVHCRMELPAGQLLRLFSVLMFVAGIAAIVVSFLRREDNLHARLLLRGATRDLRMSAAGNIDCTASGFAGSRRPRELKDSNRSRSTAATLTAPRTTQRTRAAPRPSVVLRVRDAALVAPRRSNSNRTVQGSLASV